MHRARSHTPTVPALRAAIYVVLASGLACASASTARSPWENWSRLRLDAKAIPLFSGRVEMALEVDGSTSRFTTETVARFLGARIAQSRTTSVLDARTGRTLRFESVSKNRRGRLYVFGEKGYRVDRLEPGSAGGEAPVDQWDVSRSTEFAYPVDDAGRVIAVFDYYGMLLQLRRELLNDVGDETILHVATTDGPVAFRILVAESVQSEYELADPRDGTTRKLPARALRLRIIPANPELADEGFLDMEGETELWVEATSKTLLRLEGKVPKVPGQVRLVLDQMG